MCGMGPSSKQLFRSPRRSARISSLCPQRVATAYSTRFAGKRHQARAARSARLGPAPARVEGTAKDGVIPEGAKMKMA